MCQHDYKSPEDSLKVIPVRRMVYPAKIVLQCAECGEIFTVSSEEISDIKTFMQVHTF